ncbi:MAG: macrolide ABC transporter permease [Cytophaga sp.]|nr:macrolide ABC transporter permease [Cytophaga sp.]
MLSNYFKIAFRTLLRFKGYAAINLFGLALGLATGISIMIYVLDEISYDQFHAKGDRLYRVNTVFASSSDDKGSANETNGWPIGKILEKDFPEVEAVLYTRSASFLTINYEGSRIQQKMHFVTPEFFSMFSFPLLKGNAQKALNDPYSVVISEDMEKKFFAGTDALNKTLIMGDSLNFVVTGVMANIPANSHIQSDMLVSFSTYEKLNPDFSFDTGWGNINMRNYVLLKEGTDYPAFAAKAKTIYMDRAAAMLKDWGVSAYVTFEPMEDIYLSSKSGNGMGPLGSSDRLYLLTGIAAFVIVLGCINFVNLATARSVYRAREVGLRKIAGSTRQALIAQFLSESFLLTVLSLIMAILLIAGLLPVVNQLLDKNYELSSLVNISMIAGTVLLVLIVSLLAGYYPALILSALQPVHVLKGKMQTSARGIQLRRTLVVFQFVISVSLVMGTLVIVDQLSYMQKQDLGFHKEEIVVINAARARSANPAGFETFKNQLKELAAVDEVTHTNAVPGNPGWTGQVAYPEGKSGDHAVSVEYMAIDEHYLTTLGLELIAGRGFDKAREAELKDGLVVNETAVKRFGWSSPQEAIGKRISSPSGQPEGEVIGVVKDYHQLGLQQKIGPMAMDYAPENSHLYAIRYQASNTQQLIGDLNKLWNQSFPGYDFNYFFLDQDFEKQYQSEKKLASVFGGFAVITILIAIIGLVGLVSFMVVAKTKEIGVRKILGAGALSITKLLSKEFVLLVIVANALSLPLAWYFANQWLHRFAYHTELNFMLFGWTMLIALTVTMLAVGYQTLRAANADPVHSLRQE